MIKILISTISKILPTKTAYAHCDIPCGIYDPYQAQLAAISVIRMTQMIMDLKEEKDSKKEFIHQMERLVKVKEEHAELIKHEIRVIWGDYFKDEHLKSYPNLHNLVFKIMKLASKSRQEINMDAAEELLENTQKLAEIFWKTKNRKVTKIDSSSPSGGKIVIPQ